MARARRGDWRPSPRLPAKQSGLSVPFSWASAGTWGGEAPSCDETWGRAAGSLPRGLRGASSTVGASAVSAPKLGTGIVAEVLKSPKPCLSPGGHARAPIGALSTPGNCRDGAQVLLLRDPRPAHPHSSPFFPFSPCPLELRLSLSLSPMRAESPSVILAPKRNMTFTALGGTGDQTQNAVSQLLGGGPGNTPIP